jgi:KDO2-lipid IV(A) lauroyltransferase
MAREANASIQDYVRDAKEDAGVRVIYSDTSVFSSFNMIRALRNNEIVAIQLDRPVGAGGMRRVDFFGRPALFPSGPFVLARLAGAPVIPVFAPRLGRRHYAVCVGHSYEVSRDRDPALLENAMSAVVREFEDAVRSYPTQWFQFTSFWGEQGQSSEGSDLPREEGGVQQLRAGHR